jgi:phenylacetic acid degradation operon negative regulatory protein
MSRLTVGPTAKSLILELLLAAPGHALPVRLLVLACALFDLSENNVRVALVRLSSSGLLEAEGRGAYRLGPGAEDLAREVASFRVAEQRVRKWKGGYVVAHVGTLGRADRAALRRRSRALSIVGLAELERGLYVRPDNLEGGVEGARARLHTLGLEPAANVFGASAFAPEVQARVHALWDGKALNASYKRTRTQLERWLARAADLDADVAARESFLLGGGAIRQMVYDPWLPPPLVDVDERRGFVQATLEMDRAGRQIWRRFLELHAVRQPAEEARAPSTH